jgi:DNA-binding LacI/PurR family transcriptional regulator
MPRRRDPAGLTAVENRLRGWIAGQRLLPGSRLPSERDLAYVLGASRAQVHRALVAVQAQGLVGQPSPRTRTVTGAGGDPHDLAGTVVVLSSDDGRPRVTTDLPAGLGQDIYEGVVAAVAAAGFRLLTLQPDRAARERLAQIAARRPAGFLMLPGAWVTPVGALALQTVQRAGIPAVACDDDLPPDQDPGPGVDRLGNDHAGGAAALVACLAGRGCHRLLPVRLRLTPERRWRTRRLDGHAAACRQHALPILPTLDLPPLADPDPSGDDRAAVAAGMLAPLLLGPDPPGALLAENDHLAAVLAVACRRLGRPPGDRLLIAGYDACWYEPWMEPLRAWSGYQLPVSVAFDATAYGAGAVNLLTDRIAGRLPAAAQFRQTTMQVVVNNLDHAGWSEYR